MVIPCCHFVFHSGRILIFTARKFRTELTQTIASVFFALDITSNTADFLYGTYGIVQETVCHTER